MMFAAGILAIPAQPVVGHGDLQPPANLPKQWGARYRKLQRHEVNNNNQRLQQLQQGLTLRPLAMDDTIAPRIVNTHPPRMINTSPPRLINTFPPRLAANTSPPRSLVSFAPRVPTRQPSHVPERLQFQSPAPQPPPQTLITQPSDPEHIAHLTRHSLGSSTSVTSSRGRNFGHRLAQAQRQQLNLQNQQANGNPLQPNVRTTRTKYRFRTRTQLKPAFVNQPDWSTTADFVTPTIQMPPKTAITVTSVVPLVKTFTLKHGFKSVESVVTTSAFRTSVIRPDQYEFSLHPTNSLITLTVFRKETDALNPARVTHQIITTASMQEIKLVPIKVGYSTRTNTVTNDVVVTTISQTVIGPTAVPVIAPTATSEAPAIESTVTSSTSSALTSELTSESTSTEAETPLTPTRKPVFDSMESNPVGIVDFKQVAAAGKSLYTQYTYFYSIIDGTNTRRSTRLEVVSTAADPHLDLATLKIDSTVNQDGFVSIGSGPETVHLGRRAFGGSTTEVNLAMQTFIKLEGISNVVIESIPTSLPDSGNQPTSPLPRQPILESSFAPPEAATSSPSTETPEIPVNVPTTRVVRTRRPVRVSSAAVQRGDTPVSRSRIILQNGERRPGLRVRVRPGATRLITVASPTLTSTVSDQPEESSVAASSPAEAALDDIISPTPTFAPVAELPTSHFASPVENSLTDDEIVSPSKKRVAVTVRRPQSGGFQRLRTRVRPVAPDQTDEPKVIVVTRSSLNQLGQNRPVTSRFRVMSRVVKPRPTSTEITPAPSPSVEPEIKSIVSVNEAGELVSVAVTTIPVIFGLDTSYRTVVGRSTISGFKASAIVTAHSSPVISSSAPNTPVKPSPVVVTYYTTTTHTIPFTINDKTMFTTFEVTNSRVATEPLPNLFERPTTRLTAKLSEDEVTLIVASSQKDDGIAHTLEPTLITGSAVRMDDGLRSQIAPDTPLETRTMYTTYTFFTTFYSDDTSSVASSEKIVSNLITIPITEQPSTVPVSRPTIEPSVSLSQSPVNQQPITVVETSERIETSTIYSTQTFYATLYNGSQSTITPIEETKTEILTLREPFKVTRTLTPQEASQSAVAAQSVYTKTYFTTRTNVVTLQSNDRPFTTTKEETVSNVVTFTVPGFSVVSSMQHGDSSSPVYTPQYLSPLAPVTSSEWQAPGLYTTRSTYTTLTHFITLYSGASTILSSIEEVSPTVLTEAIGQTSAIRPMLTNGAHIERTRESQVDNKSSRDVMASFVPSVSTFFMTHTFYTTLHGEISSTVASREEVTSSLVTLYVPQSQAAHIQPSASAAYDHVQPTAANDQASVTPSLLSRQLDDLAALAASSRVESSRVESSRYDAIESSIVSKVISELKSSKGLSDEEASAAIFGPTRGKSTSVVGDSTLVFFTDLILPSVTRDDGAQPTEQPVFRPSPQGPVFNVNTLLSDLDVSLISSLVSSSVQPSEGSESTATTEAIQPGATLELSDLLSGSGNTNISGSLGAAIKDIAKLLAAKSSKHDSTTHVNHKAQQQGVANRHLEPVYVPAGGNQDSEVNLERPLAPVFRPDQLAPVFNPNQHHQLESSIGANNQPGPSISSTPLLPTHRLSPSANVPDNSRAVFSQVGSGATTIFFGDVDESPVVTSSDSSVQPTRYVTSIESNTRTLTLTTTKVYYTRDSPLTITSVLTTIIPPKTFVSTIIGSRTILGTATEPTKTLDVEANPTDVGEGATTVTTTTLIFNSITTTVVRTLVIPSTGIQPTRPHLRVPVTKSPLGARTDAGSRTRKPLTSNRRPTTTTAPTVAIKPTTSTRKRPAYVPKPPAIPTLPPTGRKPSDRTIRPPLTDIGGNRITVAKVIPAPIQDDDQCKPACNVANREICKEEDTSSGKFKCNCRPGFARKQGSFECKGM